MGLLKPAWMSGNTQKALQAVEKINDQKTLEEIAKNSVCANDVRMAAIEKINDQQKLEMLGKSDEFEYLRAAAIKKLTNQNVLVDIAKNDKAWLVRKTAIEAFTDPALSQELYAYNVMIGEDLAANEAALKALTCQAALAKIVKNVAHRYIYEAAFEKLTDQSILADIANSKDDKIESIRVKAAEKLIDQALAQKIFADLATNAGDAKVRKMAAENLSDEISKQTLLQKAYVDIVINSDTWNNCCEDFAKLTEQTAFADIAKKAKNSRISEKAVGLLTDSFFLADVAKNTNVANVGEKAVEMLIDQLLLEEVAKHAQHDKVKFAAARKLNEQNATADAISKIENMSARKSAVEKLTNQATLADVAKNDMEKEIRLTAVEKLTDQTALVNIAKNDTDKEIRLTAVGKLADQAALVDVVKNDQDGFISVAAANRLTDQAQAQEAYAYIANHAVYPENGTEYHLAAYKPLFDAVRNLTDQDLLVEVAINSKYPNIRIKAMEKAGLLCDEKQHKWVNAGQCRKKCTVCGIGLYDHNYSQKDYDGSGAEISIERCKCTKCGHEGGGWARDEVQQGYCLV